MVSLATLKYLTAQKVRDAEVLLHNGRNAGAIYMMGYALEFSLKRKLSATLGFARGFPETSSELATYSAQVTRFHSLGTGIRLTQIRQIRSHHLPDLLTFSGAESRIVASLYDQWLTVKDWTPENRYIRQRIPKVKAAAFLLAARQILKEIS